MTVSLGGQEEGAVSGYIVERGLARQSEMFDRQALEDALAADRRASRATASPCRTRSPCPSLLLASDMISIVPAPLAEAFARAADLHAKPLPYDVPT